MPEGKKKKNSTSPKVSIGKEIKKIIAEINKIENGGWGGSMKLRVEL